MSKEKEIKKNESKLIKFLLNRNTEQSILFCRKSLDRKRYRVKHPTEFVGLVCMDGRLHLSTITKIPIGIIQPYRNIGGKFDFGWPWFGFLIRKWVEYSVAEKGRDCIILITYHFSKGDHHRGCAGFNYDTDAAKAHTAQLVAQAERIYGKDHNNVYPVQIGVETDEEYLIIHGSNGSVLDLGKEEIFNEETLTQKIQLLFPDMKSQMVHDFIPLLLGNQIHTREIKALNRTVLDSSHREQGVVIGRGVDWLNLPNKVIIIGPYDPNLSAPIEVAANLLLDNIKKGRVPAEEGIVLMTSTVYGSQASLDYFQAIEKVIYFKNLGIKVISEKVPELLPYLLEPVVGIVDYNTRKFLRINPETYEPYEC